MDINSNGTNNGGGQRVNQDGLILIPVVLILHNVQGF